MKKAFKVTIILCILAAILVSSGCNKRSNFLVAKDKKAIEGIDQIAEKLNAFFTKEGYYPEDIFKLREDGFMSRFPPNPYQEEGQEMMLVKFSTPSAGDFSYIKIYRDKGSDEVMYYVLILWGPSGIKGADVFDDTFDYDNNKFIDWTLMPDGKPDRYLKIIKSELQLKTAGEGK